MGKCDAFSSKEIQDERNSDLKQDELPAVTTLKE